MGTFKSLNDFSLNKLPDEKNFRRIIDINFSTWKQITHILRENLNFEFSNIWEIFLNLSENLSQQEKAKLSKYFNIRGDKIWSRWIWYYGLFWDAYKVENRKIKYTKDFWNSFWSEYDEYIDILSTLKDNTKLLLLYLDNYKNFVLLWIYILITIKKSYSKQQVRPIQNMSFAKIKNDKIDNILQSLIKTYEIILENIILWALNKDVDNIFMIPSLKDLYKGIKKIIIDNDIVETKKWKISLTDYFIQNKHTLQVWFEKMFRNVREEDNLWIILSFFLQKQVNLNSIKNKENIFNLIEKFKKIKKEEYILSNMYWGIEFALISKYLWYESWFISFSSYHLKQKDIYEYLDDVYFSLNWENLKQKQVVLVDDNVFSWNTLSKLQNLLLNNHISVKCIVTPKIYLKKLKEDSNIQNISEIKKHIALNTIYVLPRINKNNRTLNVLIENKIKKFRCKFWKEFRNL